MTTIANVYGDKLRVAILQILANNDKTCVQDITEMLKNNERFVTQPNVSQALSVLRKNNIIDYDRINQYKYYYVKNKDLYFELQKVLEKYEKETLGIRSATS